MPRHAAESRRILVVDLSPEYPPTPRVPFRGRDRGVPFRGGAESCAAHLERPEHPALQELVQGLPRHCFHHLSEDDGTEIRVHVAQPGRRLQRFSHHPGQCLLP